MTSDVIGHVSNGHHCATFAPFLVFLGVFRKFLWSSTKFNHHLKYDSTVQKLRLLTILSSDGHTDFSTWTLNRSMTQSSLQWRLHVGSCLAKHFSNGFIQASSFPVSMAIFFHRHALTDLPSELYG